MVKMRQIIKSDFDEATFEPQEDRARYSAGPASPAQNNEEEGKGGSDASNSSAEFQCIKTTLKSIIGLIDSAPVTICGCVQVNEKDAAGSTCQSSELYSPVSPTPSPCNSKNDLLELEPVHKSNEHTCCDCSRSHNDSDDSNNSNDDSNDSNNSNDSPCQTAAVSDCESESYAPVGEGPESPSPDENSGADEDEDGENEDEDGEDEDEDGEEEEEEEEEDQHFHQPPSPVEEEYEVDCILGKKFERQSGHLFYLVKWKGYDLNESTWEPYEHLSNCRESIELFEKKERKRKRKMKWSRKRLHKKTRRI